MPKQNFLLLLFVADAAHVFTTVSAVVPSAAAAAKAAAEKPVLGINPIFEELCDESMPTLPG